MAFKVGTCVVSMAFGTGTVMESNDDKTRVRFDRDDREKTLLNQYLQPSPRKSKITDKLLETIEPYARACMSEGCTRPLRPGDRIVQIAAGNCYNGNITPAWTSEDQIVGEWHYECFREFPLHAQAIPYICQTCGQPIAHGDEVHCAFVGDKAPEGQLRPERRGHCLYMVRHVRH